MRIFVASAAAALTDHRPHGEGLIARGLLDGLAARGHEVVACARTVELEREPAFLAVELGRSSFESVEPLAYAAAVTRTLARLGGPGRFDVAHWLFPQEPDERVWEPPRGLPLVVGPWSPAWPGGRGRPLRAGDAVRALGRPLFRGRERRFLDAAATIMLSNPDAAAVVPPGLRARSRVVPFGVDADAYPPAPLPAEPVVLFLGRLERLKGVRELVPAFARARAAAGAGRLVLAGDGPERAWVEAQARRLGLGASVSVLGAVPHARTPRLLAEASLLCLPSHGEPYGMAALEAMAAGRAVVATGEGGPRHLVDPVRGGRLVPPRDPAALGDALAELIADPGLAAALGAFNRDRVERELSLERMLDTLEDVYGAAAARREAA